MNAKDSSGDQPVTRTEAEGATVDLPEGLGFFSTGQVLGERYEILEMLGRGGMGEVWRAFDLKLRVEVGLKALRDDLFQSERRLELLRQEVRAAREVVSPNVCRIFDLIEIDGRELVSMEYVDGATLLGVLQERGPLELKEAQDIASQFLSGLEAIHKAGLVHRDVKPENIMLTRAGRVVVMDFGLARGPESGAGSVSGTPAYMAPEHAAGHEVDARADVYSAGVVLAEMVSPAGIKSYESRQSVWEGVRSEPAQVSESPWASVIKRAVARDRERRQNSAHTLIRELEEVTLRVEGAEDLHPYPGLASFTEEDAEYFFGREAEVEQMWRKLEGPTRVLGIMGPSGAGKSSFIGAGLTPNAPPGWSIVRCTPGNAATASLRSALTPKLTDQSAVLQSLMAHPDDPEEILDAVSAWRKKGSAALIVIDQFEELFTLNPREEQQTFASLVGRLPLEADTHVVVSMRDDFAVECNNHRALQPVFHELTVLNPPTGGNLRRALVQPAAKCGYRFEDDDLVDEMLSEVEGERGTLPLLAFALARLWETRDRETGLLTRQAYNDIGGVGGALARHAEATVDRIGVEHVSIVRELFRNLVTAEGTRAVREWNDLFSVFRDSSDESPATVLRALIDARLLTSYEVREDEYEPIRMVEIIHESLLVNWPRLVGWQTQDADSARMREELRQSARAWDEHGRHDDRLWTGSAFREYQLWRERYPGGLTDLEEAFATAMSALSTRQRRRRRWAVLAGITVLLAVLAVVTILWRQAVVSTRLAEAAARRSDASRLITLGRVALDRDSTGSLAYAMAALDLADTPEARRLAMRAVWAGPPATVLPAGQASWELTFSPDGRWLAVGYADGRVVVFPRDGDPPVEVQGPQEKGSYAWWLSFSPDSSHLVGSLLSSGGELRVWETEGWTLKRTIQSPERLYERPNQPGTTLAFAEFEADSSSIVTVTLAAQTPGQDISTEVPKYRFMGSWVVRRWALSGGPSEKLGEVPGSFHNIAILDLPRRLLVAGIGSELYLHNLDRQGEEPARLVARHPGEFAWFGVAFHPIEQRLAATDTSGSARVWPLTGNGETPERELEAAGWPWGTSFSPNGRWLAQSLGANAVCALWDLHGPSLAEPLRLRGPSDGSRESSFSPDEQWLATDSAGRLPDVDSVALWPLSGNHPRELRFAGSGTVLGARFHPDGSRIFAVSTDEEGVGSLISISLEGGSGIAAPVVYRGGFDIWGFAVDPLGRFVVVGSEEAVQKIPLDGGPPTVLEGLDYGGFMAIGPEGRYLATGRYERRNEIVVLDLDSGERQVLEPPGEGAISLWSCSFDQQGRLLATRSGVVSRWDPKTVSTEVLMPEGALFAAPLSDGERLLVSFGTSRDDSVLMVLDLEDGSRTVLPQAHQNFRGLDWDPTGSIWVSSHAEGEVRVSGLLDEEPHVLLSPETVDTFVRMSPDARWILTRGEDSLRLWPMPDLTRQPLHTLPHDELMTRLMALTNLRAVPAPDSTNGYSLEPDFSAYRGWAEVPEW